MSNELQIPKNWETASLVEDLPYIKTGVTDYKGKKRYFSTGSIKSDSLIAEGEYTFGKKPSRANRIVSKGDVLQARMKNTDKAILIDSKLDGQLFSTGFFQIRADEINLNSKFIFYYLQSLFFKKAKDKLCSGSTQEALNDDGARKIKIPIPPFKEQQKIVFKIEELISDLDKGIESLTVAQQQLKVYRQSVLKGAFEGRLTSQNVNGELPKGWKWVKLDEVLVSVKNGYGKKPDDEGGKKILRISSVRPNSVELSDVRYLKKDLSVEYEVLENDLLFTRYNGTKDFVGVCGRVPYLKEKIFYPDKLIRCRPIAKEHFHSIYLQFASNCGESRKFILSKLKTTAGQTGIAGSEIKQIPIPLAPMDEQKIIVQEIQSRLSVCDKVEETISQSLQQAETLRQSILKKAFEGKLVTSELKTNKKRK